MTPTFNNPTGVTLSNDRRRDVAEIVQEFKIPLKEDHFPPSISWTKPQGGMFLWVTLPKNSDSVKLLPRAIDEKVAYVPDKPFFSNGECLNTLRLNYSNSTPEKIRLGIKRLAKIF